jgi:hypothetical protein
LQSALLLKPDLWSRFGERQSTELQAGGTHHPDALVVLGDW